MPAELRDVARLLKTTAILLGAMLLLAVITIWHESAAGPRWEAEKKRQLEEYQDFLGHSPSPGESWESFSNGISELMERKRSQLKDADNPYAWFR